MDNTELAFQIEMLTQIIGRLCENAHLDGMLENLALQYGFTHEQYIGIFRAVQKRTTYGHCHKDMLKKELDSFFPEPLPDLVFAQILRGFLISNRKDKTTESITYQNIYHILQEMNMTSI